jgi:DNA-binding beta-propeller fold protein YncE
MWKPTVSTVAALLAAAAVSSYGYGNLVASYPSPAAYPAGLGFVDDARMVCTTNPSSPPKYAFFLNRTTGSVTASFLMAAASGFEVRGCDAGPLWSSGRYIWGAWEQGSAENRITQFTTTGSLVSNFYAPSASPMGIGLYYHAATSYLYYTDVGNSYLYQLHATNGSVYGSYHLSFVPGDLAYDSDHDCLWIAGTMVNRIYQTTLTGSIMASFATATAQPRGVGYEPTRGYLWVGESTSVISLYETAGTGVIPTSLGKVKTLFR